MRKAIDDGVRYLKKEQTKQGNWEGVVLNLLADLEGGVTALTTLALLNCGVKPTEAEMARALEYLRTLPPKKTYVVGLQNMVFAEAREKKDLPLIQRNADWLISKGLGWQINAQSKVVGGELKGWSYPGASVADNSNTQYALLGLYAAKQTARRSTTASGPPFSLTTRTPSIPTPIRLAPGATTTTARSPRQKAMERVSV